MSERILEGLWDCPYCQAKAIGGLTKHCPCCGHPQDDDIKFYLGEEKKYLDEDLAAQYGQGADWVCPFCNSLNRVHFEYCHNCAAPKDAMEKDYFSAKETSKAEQPKKPEDKPQSAQQTPKKRKVLRYVLLALLAVILIAFWPRTYSATVSTAEWAREIDIEAYRTVQESDWSVPSGGRVYDQKTEFSHYVQVLDHYETRTRRVSEQVYDGEDHHTSYSDNGDGTFTEKSYSTPRYRTEWRTETYEAPVYRDKPIYATKYYYEIEKWVVDRTAAAKEADSTPYWPDYTLAKNERAGATREVYTLKLHTDKKDYQCSLPLSMWEKYSKGDSIKITVVAGEVTKLDDESVE